MTEIKSTMDLVMERAAKFGKASSEDLLRDEARKKGMQLTVSYLDGEENNLAERLADNKNNLNEFRTGMIESLMRNIYLPRDDVQQERTERAVKGLIELAGGAGDVTSICQEMQQILAGYMQHREQLHGQLEEQIRMQYEQLLAQQGGGQPENMKMDPTLQPKFREEWSRIEAELTSKYTEAIDQHKIQLGQRMGI